jgi:energy-coupling factor transporter ATP-binding protein EcfA2
MVKLKRLLISKFRNVRPGTELTFDDGINILLGRNGTGKTTLLELISAVARGDFSAFAQTELNLQFELSFEKFRVEGEVSNTRLGAGEFMLGTPAFEAAATFWIYDQDPQAEVIEVRVVGGQGTKIQGGRSESLGTLVVMKGPLLVSVLQAVRSIDEVLPIFFFAFAATRFDEALGFYTRMFHSESGQLRVIVFDQGGPPLVISPQFPSEFSLWVAKHPEQVDEDALSFTDEQFTFLRLIREALGVASLELRADRIRKMVDKEQKQTVYTYGNFRVLVRLADGTEFTQDELSHGEKRLLMFLYYVASHAGVVIADELINGLHHAWIDLCIKAIDTRQAFLTSQNPLLFEYLPLRTATEAKSRFILCEREPAGETWQWHWHGMDDEQAEQLFDAYAAGIEDVGQILRTRGLW